MQGRDAAIQVIVQQAKGGLTDRLLDAALLADGVDSFDTGRLELHPGIQVTAWGEYGVVTDGSAPFPGKNGHGHTVF